VFANERAANLLTNGSVLFTSFAMIRGLFAVLIILTAGCSTSHQLRMMVSGPPGIPYTCDYQIGGLSGSVKSATSGGGFDTFLEIPAGDGHCQIVKGRPGDELSVIVSEGRGKRLNGFVPAGKSTVRFSREAGQWKYQVAP
jgi:hypothetical protein